MVGKDNDSETKVDANFAACVDLVLRLLPQPSSARRLLQQKSTPDKSLLRLNYSFFKIRSGLVKASLSRSPALLESSTTQVSLDMSASPAPPPRPGSSADGAKRKHATSAVDLQRAQLDKLLKDPSKPAFVPAAPKEKTIRPAREMMKNVQGSSAGAGSGEFHVYKASRRREYERLKMMEEQSQKVRT